ncbi:Cyclic nucleotide-binding protein [Pseudocohnilembus persalinus]|uniref:Cyclic nucleotide-binding protein n=1 Tax=Pseudocohnilembus persalinus TaxID=266149 RepID=A0A0V0QN10_PSEPJ|nr:Cyclic nucleotide-binding protein [Pseudocohnilembus persalinus]|eukprot:KRX03646.1 Cyclic nucleotide-binding protein [Pseudocohnilembus persalinus]
MDNINSSDLVIKQENQDGYKTMRKILKRTPEFRRENDLKQIVNFMSEIQYFKQFEENGENIVLKKCCQYMQLEEFKQGETVFQINSVGEKFYVIFTGEVEVLIPIVPGNFDKLMQITTLQQGKGFGELALINNTPRMAEIRCLQETQLLVIDKKTFNRSIRIRDQQKINQQLYYIKQLPFMQNARAHVQKQVYSRCLQLETNPGYYLFKEGDPSDNIYIIKEGEYGLKTLTCGMYFGEEDLYFNQNRSFTIRCEKIGSLAVIPKLLFQEFIFKDQYSQKYFKDTVPRKVKDLQEQVNRIRQNVMKLDNAKFLIEDRNYLLMNRSFQQECKIRQEKLKKSQKEKQKQANIQSQQNLESNLESSGKQIQKTQDSNTNDQKIKNQSNQNQPLQDNYSQKNRKVSNNSDNSRNQKKEQREKNKFINKIIDKDLDILKKKKNTKWFVKTREQSAAQLEAKDPKTKFFRKKKEIIWGNLADLINKQYADYDDIEENQQEDNQGGSQNINQRISNKQDNIFKQEIDPEFKDNQFVFINQVFKDDKYKVNQDVNKQLKLYDINIKKEIQIFEAQQNPYKNYLKIDEKLNNKSQNQINQTIQKITQANKTMNELNQNQLSLTINNQEDFNLLSITRLEPSLLSNRSQSQCKNYIESKFSQKKLTDFSSIQAKNVAFFNQDPYFSIQKIESEVQYQDFPEFKNQIISKDTNSQSYQHLGIPPKFPSTGQIDGQKKAAFSQSLVKFQDNKLEQKQGQVHFDELDTDLLNQNSMRRCKTQQSTNNRQQVELNFDTYQNQNQTNSVQNLDYKSGFNIYNKNMQISAFSGRKTILRPTTSLNKISKSQISEFQNQAQQSEYYINENSRKEIINNNYLIDNQVNKHNNIKTWSNLLESKNQVSKNQFSVKTLENIDLYEFNENVKSTRELNNQILNNTNNNIKQKQQLKQKIFTGLLSCDKKNKNYKQSRQLLIHSAKGKNPKGPIFSKENQQRDKYLGKEKIKRNQLMLRKMQENQVLNINNAYIQN